MIIERVSADGYKNLSEVDISPCRGINLILGDNAQGKTNLIEAIWLCTGCRSFRGTRDKDFIGFEKDKCEVSVDFADSRRTQSISFLIRKGNIKDKTIKHNGVPVPLLSKLFGILSCVVFTPEDLSIAKGSPDKRRSFVDLSASQIKHSFVWALNKYENVLSQRNALIKDISFGSGDPSQLEIWDEQLAATGAYISVVRDTYIRSLASYASVLYRELTKGNERLGLVYQSSVYKSLDGSTDHSGELKRIYLERLREGIKDDIKAGYTLTGIHRDDLGIFINDLPVREFGSQGQQRSAAIVLKAAQARLVAEQSGEAPVMLLDDVLSELDPSRQSFVLDNAHGMQVFITACDKSPVQNAKEVNVINIRNGTVNT